MLPHRALAVPVPAERWYRATHVIVRDATDKTTNEQDFVYADRHVSFDNDPDYVMAAVSCDEAQGDGENRQQSD